MIKMVNNQNVEEICLKASSGFKSSEGNFENLERDIRRGMTISTLAIVGWIAALVIHTFLWSSSFTFFQNTIIGIVSFLFVGVSIISMWMIGGSKYRSQFEEFFKEDSEE
jgi:hypothetical protein